MAERRNRAEDMDDDDNYDEGVTTVPDVPKGKENRPQA